MECFSEFAVLKYNGEMETADEPRHIVDATVDKEPDSIIVTYPHIVQQIKLNKDEPWTEVRVEWRTKYRLTSGVVYDGHSDSYVAACGGDTVRVAPSIIALDSADKYTFQRPIDKILTRTNKVPLILFRNGDCLTLPYGLENCKMFHRRAIIKESFSIIEAASYTRDDTDYVCFIAKDNNSYTIVNYRIKEEACDYQSMRTVKVSEARDYKEREVLINGCCIVAGTSQNPSICFSWCDYYIGMYDVVKRCWRVKFYPLAIQSQYKCTLVCLKRNIILFSGKFYNIYDDTYNASYTVTMHKTLPRLWSYGYLELKPYSSDTRAYDCDDHVVLVEPSRATVWSVNVTGRERTPCFLNDSKVLIRQLRTEEFLPIFGDPKKIDHWRS